MLLFQLSNSQAFREEPFFGIIIEPLGKGGARPAKVPEKLAVYIQNMRVYT